MSGVRVYSIPGLPPSPALVCDACMWSSQLSPSPFLQCLDDFNNRFLMNDTTREVANMQKHYQYVDM